MDQTVAVSNMPAGSMAEYVAKSEPDGYTLLMTGMILWLSPFLRDNVANDPVRDFAPVSVVASSPNVLVVHPQLPVQRAGDLISLAQRGGVKLRFTSSGAGSSTHLAGELFKVMAGIDMEHVPCKGNKAAVTPVASDHAGLKGIALTTGETAHTNGTTPFGDLDVFGFEVVRGEDGGFRK